MTLLLALLAGLCAQVPDTSTPTTVLPPAAAPTPTVDSLRRASPDSPANQDSTLRPDTTKPGPTAPAAPLPVVPQPSGPVMDAGPIGPDLPVGPVGPAAPAKSPEAPAGPSGPLTQGVVVPPPTFGPSGSDRPPSDSALLKRSTAGAMGLSLLLPGMGHRWIGRSSRAPIYHALDLLGFTAVVVSWQMGNRSLESATEIANRHAGSSLGDDPDADLLSAMRNYRSRRPQAGRHDSYDEAMLLSGKSTTWQFPDDAAHDWDWGSRENPENDSHLRSFESQLRLWRTSQVALYSAAGTMVVLRLVSALDVLRLNRSSAARAGIALQTNPIPGGMESKMAVNF